MKSLITFVFRFNIIAVWFSTVLLALPNTMIASQSDKTSTSTNPMGSGLLILAIICLVRRKKEIGGWLLYYFCVLYLGLFISIALIGASFSNYNPAAWEDKALYSLFLTSTVPGIILLLAQAVMSYRLITRRNWQDVNILRVILLFEIIFSLIAIPIDANHWPDNIAFDIIGLISPLIWLPYFTYSKRVRSVYQSKNWNDFLLKKYPSKTN